MSHVGEDSGSWRQCNSALAYGYSSRDRERKLIVMFQAFVDDSTSQVGDKRLYLAAYINIAERWASFADEWAMVLNEPLAIDYFKDG